MIHVPRQYVISNPEIPKTTGLYLYDHISMPVLIVPIGLKKISHYITESIVQTPLWAVFYLGHIKKRHVSETEKVFWGAGLRWTRT